MYIRTTFSGLLTQLITNGGYRFSKKAYQMISDAGVQVSYSTFNRYKLFNVVPPFETAKAILNAFGYSVSDEELSGILEYSREQLKVLNDEDKKSLSYNVTLNADSIGCSIIELQSAVNVKSDEYGSFAAYASALIVKDMKESGLLPEESELI